MRTRLLQRVETVVAHFSVCYQRDVQILRLLTFRTSKDETDGEIFDRILNVLTAAGYNSEKIRFRFEDHPQSPYVKRVSAVQRAIKAYPSLAPFRGEVVQQWNNNTQLTVLSNFQPWLRRPELRTPAARCESVPTSVLSEVCHGIPKRFPFWSANIIFDDVEPFNTLQTLLGNENETLPARDLTGPGIVFESKWWRSGRFRDLEAVLAMPFPDDDGEPLRFSTALQALVDSLGNVSHTELKLSPAPADRARVGAQLTEAKMITERYKKDSFPGSADSVLPYPLPKPAEPLGVPLILRREEGIPSVKELLKQELSSLGYRYKSSLSGQGCYTLQKKGPQNYVLTVFADVSPMAGQFCATFGVKTPQGAFSLPIQLPPFGHNYPVDEHLSAVIKNTAFVVQNLEATYVRELEAILGVAPAWFPKAILAK